LLDLGLAERAAMVSRTLNLLVQRPDLADHVQAPGTRLLDVFDRLDRALLILGAPGSGKTTLLLTLAQDLLIRAAQDPEQPIPVVFPLSSWATQATQQRPLDVWLVDALNEQYDVPRKTGQAWVDTDQILPLLDGLDEVVPEHRVACVEAINSFRQDHGLLPLVVCSRVAAYDALGTRLRLQGALVVQPLTPAQVESYLTQVGQPLATVRDALRDDPTLWELLDTPLMLTIVTLAYTGEPVAALRMRGTSEEWRQHLFAAYVDRMFRRRSAITYYSRQQTEHWLRWLAWQLVQHNQTIFYLEHMQPNWLLGWQRWVLTQGVRLLAGLVGGLVIGLSGGLVGGLIWGLVAGWKEGLINGVGYAIIFGLVGGLIGGLAGHSREITPIETVHWSWSRFSSDLLYPLHRVLRGGWAFRRRVGLVTVPLVFLSPGPGTLLLAMIYKLGAAFIAGLSSGEITTKTIPNEGIYRSARMALISGLSCGLIVGLIVGLGFWLILNWLINTKVEPNPVLAALFPGLSIGLITGLITGLRYGGRACLQHLVLRLMLRYHGYAPWHYAGFLDFAAERLFLRKIGGGYSFMHRRLQEYFAARYTKPGNVTHQEVAAQARAPS
jgi:hypothetical protein